MEGLLLVKERREMKPFLFKAGIALALSFAGYLYSQFRARQAVARLRLPPPPPPAPADEPEAAKNGGGLKEELRLIKYEEVSPKFTNGTITISITGLSPMSRSSGDDEGYLLPEFNEILQQGFETPAREPDTPKTNTSTPKKAEIKEDSEMEQEIAKLRDLVHILQERERNLEFELFEYYGLKEQENAMRELENRLKINVMEAKLFSLKIESLQADNRRLESQVSDQVRVMAELEAAKSKIKMLKRKSKFDSEQAKEKMEALHERVVALRDSERRDRGHEEELERSTQRLKDLETEVAKLRQDNSKLAQDIVDLTNKLESTQILASSCSEKSEVTEALEEAKCLREKNDELMNELEQLQTDRCTDVEELVYLRWVNACLRYELRNYQPPAGKTLARDLSKNLSPKSERKAKQLILEYANSDHEEKLLMDFDSEYCSSSRASSLTDTGEIDDASSTTKNSSKTKFFTKLKHLVLGKDSHSSRFSPSDTTSTRISYSERRSSISNCSFEEVMGRCSYDSGVSSCTTVDNAPGNHLLASDENRHSKTSWDQRLSMASSDAQKLRISSEEEENSQHCKSEVGSSHGCNRFILGERDSLGSPSVIHHDHEALDSPEKSELKKFAGALRDKRGSQHMHRRSGSFTFF